jgi:hypothetical protein
VDDEITEKKEFVGYIKSLGGILPFRATEEEKEIRLVHSQELSSKKGPVRGKKVGDTQVDDGTNITAYCLSQLKYNHHLNKNDHKHLKICSCFLSGLQLCLKLREQHRLKISQNSAEGNWCS